MARKRLNGEGSVVKRRVKRADGTHYYRYFAQITSGYDGATQEKRHGPWRESATEARQDLASLQQELQTTGFHPVADQSLGEYLDGWLERAARTKKFRTYQTYEGDLRNHVKPRLGSVKLRDIRRLHVQNLVDEVFREAHVSGRKGQAVARKVRSCLRTALQDAVDLEVLMRNPCDGVKVPAEPVSRIEIWSDKDHHAFMETVAKSRLYPIIYTALTSGMREGELCALKWEDLEVLAPEQPDESKQLLIHIRRTLVYATGRYREVAARRMAFVTGNFYFDDPKTKSSKSSVVVGPDTLELLGVHLEAQLEEQARHPLRWQDFGLVFPATGGLPQDPSNLLRDYQALIDKAGIPRLSFHDLRDTHASRALAAGVDIGTVSERLRHSRKSTTLDRYAHVLESSRRRAALTMDDLMGAKQV